MNVFVASGETITSSFSYANWQDHFSKTCLSAVCGTMTWDFIVYDNTGTKNAVMTTTTTAPIHTFDIADDTASKTVTLSVFSNDDNMGGNYRVKIVGTLDCTNICTSPPSPVCLTDCLDVSWTNFKLNIVNVCDQNNPCSFTTLLDYDATTLVDMTAYVDGIEVKQSFTRWSDKVSNLGCDVEKVPATGCQTLVYKLVYVADLSTVESTLAVVVATPTTSPPYIKVKVTNYNHCGTHLVKLRGDMIYLGQSVAYAYGNDFNLNIDCCNVKSCLNTQLVPHEVGVHDFPTDY